MFSSKSVIALLASVSVAAAGSQLPGNSVWTPGLQEAVPKGKPYSITWDPAGIDGTVSLILLRGPSTNVVPLQTIVSGISANPPSYSWNVPCSLEADVTHYGIQMVVDASGDYQYTTQFGIADSDACSASSSSSAAASSTPAPASSVVASSAVSSAVAGTSSLAGHTVSAISTSCAESTLITKSSTGHIASTGFPVANSSIVAPTKPITYPTGLYPNSTGTGGLTLSTGAAGHVQAALGFVGAVAGLVMVL